MAGLDRLPGVVLGCLALAACGGGGGDGGGGGGSFSLDSPTFLTVGVPLSALSSNTTSGTAGNQATVTLNGDGSVTLGLPGSDQLTLSNDDIFEIITTPSGTLERYTYQTAAGDRATVDIGRDLAGTDLYLLSLVDRAGSTLGYETAMVVGDETTSMPPTGSANYRGVVRGSLFVGGSLPDNDGIPGPDIEFRDIQGFTDITADFANNTVDVTFDSFASGVTGSAFGNPLTGSLSATGLPITDSLYAGTISGTLDGTALSGPLNGAFYGSDAAGTAGTFEVEDSTGSVEFVAGFGGRRQ